MSILCGFAGTLTADAITRTSAAGKDWTSVNVKIGTGKSTQWSSVAIFGDGAVAAASLKEGDSVYIEGRLELRRWENHGGDKMSGLSVVASFCRPINLHSKPERETPKPKSEKPAPAESGRARAERSDYAPLGRTDDPISSGRIRSDDAMDDDVPFLMEWR